MSGDRFEAVTAMAVPLLVDNIDTDVITPIGRMLEGREAMIHYAFESLRFRSDGTLDPACPLNDPTYSGAQILIAGENFACGSSRETAVWAVKGLGYRVVIAKTFGDIFFSNCFKNGVLSIALPAESVDLLGEAARRRATFSVDLDNQKIAFDDTTIAFEISALRKEMLSRGLDDLGLIERRRNALDGFEDRDMVARPWVYLR